MLLLVLFTAGGVVCNLCGHVLYNEKHLPGFYFLFFLHYCKLGDLSRKRRILNSNGLLKRRV